MNYVLKTSILLILVLLAGACSSLKFPGVYRINVQQGNYIEQDMIDQLKVGLTKRQVRYIMGSPLIEDTFNNDRWDYYYSVRRGDKEIRSHRFTVYFEDDLLASWGGNHTPIKKQIEEEQKEALDKTKKRKDSRLD